MNIWKVVANEGYNNAFLIDQIGGINIMKTTFNFIVSFIFLIWFIASLGSMHLQYIDIEPIFDYT